ncbi:glycoside hydrolase family 19 protein [Sinorhizobium meliloti]|uniref:glycoside hydrolase family 19 protein n=1 Tax=Rhizobium meliloti TaxID=382 RepID=UPI001F39FC15|nr:hypothetical protein [Sinorhizobium meliloti]
MDRPHRLAQYFAQLMYESGDFRYDREIWGPTPTQQRYDTRTDLGNTLEKDGDGYLYRGRTGMQLTGKDNYRQFRNWCRAAGLDCSDFVKDPDAVNADPWKGLVPLFYWDIRDLNRWADEGDAETITKKINDGKNGLAARFDRLARISLVLLGYRADNVLQFQGRPVRGRRCRTENPRCDAYGARGTHSGRSGTAGDQGGAGHRGEAGPSTGNAAQPR